MEADTFFSHLSYLWFILSLCSTDNVLKPEHLTNLIISQLVLIGDIDPSSTFSTIWWNLYKCMLDQVLDTDEHLDELRWIFTKQWVIHPLKHLCLLHLRQQVPQSSLCYVFLTFHDVAEIQLYGEAIRNEPYFLDWRCIGCILSIQWFLVVFGFVDVIENAGYNVRGDF